MCFCCLTFGGKSGHNVEARGQFADARVFDRNEIRAHGRASFIAANPSPDAVLLVARIALDEELGGPGSRPFILILK